MAFIKEMMGGGTSAGQASAICGAGGSVVATGSTIADAAPILASNVIVTAADGTKGAILPGMKPGESCVVFNNSGSTLKVYPASASVAISVAGTGVGTAGAAFSQLTYKATQYICQSSTQILAITSA